MIDGDLLLKYSPLVLTLGQIVMGWLMWRLSKVFASKDEVTKVELQQVQLSIDVQQVRADQRLISQRLDQLPTHSDLAEIRVQLASIAAVVPELKEATRNLATYIQIIVEADRKKPAVREIQG